jgi:type IV pilus assembly protein PilA
VQIITKAFSLIEVMVVIAIVSLLTAIAIPSYNNYVIRTKFAELISVVEPYKNETRQAFDATGSPPADRTDTLNTTYVKDVQLYRVDSVEMIHVHPQNFFPEFDAFTGSPLMFIGEVQNEILVWRCCRHNSGPIPTQYLPKNCQALCS